MLKSWWYKQVFTSQHTIKFCSAVFLNSPSFQYLLRNKRLTFWEISVGLNFTSLKDPSHPQCFARIEWEIRHFLCPLKSGFFHSELKSGYIRANTASLGFIHFFGLKKLIAVTSGWLFWCCLLFFSWNVRDNARTLSGLCSPSRGSTKTVKLMKKIIIQGPSWLLH